MESVVPLVSLWKSGFGAGLSSGSKLDDVLERVHRGEEEVVHLSSLNAGDRAGLQGGTAVLAAGLGHHGAPGVPSLSFSEGMVRAGSA